MVDDGEEWGQNGTAGGSDPSNSAWQDDGQLEAGKSVQQVFVGVYERQLDERGRVALPTPHRSGIGEKCYLTFGEDGCVRIMSEETFDSEAREMLDGVKSGAISRSKQRAFSSSAVIATLDKQGRIVIDQRLRAHAGIEPEAPVVILGSLDHIEVWKPSRYEAEEALGQAEMAGDGGGTQ
jgi:MraZ protein